MADWPDLDIFKTEINVPSEDHDDSLEPILAAAIAYVKDEVGDWDEGTDTPDDALAAAALRMAILMVQNPGSDAPKLASDPPFQGFVRGHRHAFAIG
jgi:hypothetical protein